MYRALGPSAKETCKFSELSSAALGSGLFVALLSSNLVAFTLTSSGRLLGSALTWSSAASWLVASCASGSSWSLSFSRVRARADSDLGTTHCQ